MENVPFCAVHHSIEGMFAIRQGRWKMIEGRGSGGWTKGGEDDLAPGQLYDLVEDYSETTNLYLERPDPILRLKISFLLHSSQYLIARSRIKRQ